MRYEVSLKGGTLGMFSFGYLARVDATDRAEAIQVAKAKAEADGFPGYDRPTVVELRTYAITLRGRKDKRRRETYYAEATDPKHALFEIYRRGVASRFAGSVTKLDHPSVVSIVEV
jgi:hypothetical protein